MNLLQTSYKKSLSSSQSSHEEALDQAVKDSLASLKEENGSLLKKGQPQANAALSDAIKNMLTKKTLATPPTINGTFGWSEKKKKESQSDSSSSSYETVEEESFKEDEEEVKDDSSS